MSNISVSDTPLEGPLGFLGPEGSWTHQAARALAADPRELVPLAADRLLEAYATGQLPRICLPYHSSLAGVTPYFEMTLGLSRCWVERDFQRPIEHALVAIAPVDPLSIVEVIGHPVALAEVQPWIDRHLPHARPALVDSGGQALPELIRRNRLDCVAVIPPHACDAGQATVLIEAIPTVGPNVTRWWVLGPQGQPGEMGWVWGRLKAAHGEPTASVIDLLEEQRAQGYFSLPGRPAIGVAKVLVKQAATLQADLSQQGWSWELIGATRS